MYILFIILPMHHPFSSNGLILNPKLNNCSVKEVGPQITISTVYLFRYLLWIFNILYLLWIFNIRYLLWIFNIRYLLWIFNIRYLLWIFNTLQDVEYSTAWFYSKNTRCSPALQGFEISSSINSTVAWRIECMLYKHYGVPE